MPPTVASVVNVVFAENVDAAPVCIADAIISPTAKFALTVTLLENVALPATSSVPLADKSSTSVSPVTLNVVSTLTAPLSEEVALTASVLSNVAAPPTFSVDWADNALVIVTASAETLSALITPSIYKSLNCFAVLPKSTALLVSGKSAVASASYWSDGPILLTGPPSPSVPSWLWPVEVANALTKPSNSPS